MQFQKIITMVLFGLGAWCVWYAVASYIARIMREHREIVETRLRSPGWVPKRRAGGWKPAAGLCGAGGRRNVKREGGAE